MILALKTDQPEAELYLLKNGEIFTSLKWLAHRQLSNSLLEKIDELLKQAQITLPDLEGLLVYLGPGSFTGLRIGISVMNALAYSLKIPITGTTGQDWLSRGVSELSEDLSNSYVSPLYGSQAHITMPKK